MLDKSLDRGVAEHLGLPNTPITHNAPPADQPKSNAKALDTGKAGSSGLDKGGIVDSGIRRVGVQKAASVGKGKAGVGTIPSGLEYEAYETKKAPAIEGGAFDGSYKRAPFHKQQSDEGYP